MQMRNKYEALEKSGLKKWYITGKKEEVGKYPNKLQYERNKVKPLNFVQASVSRCMRRQLIRVTLQLVRTHGMARRK